MANVTPYEVVMDAAVEVAAQAELSMARIKDHAEGEATLAVVAAFRTFAHLIGQAAASAGSEVTS